MPVVVVSGGWGGCRLAQRGGGGPPPSTTSLPFPPFISRHRSPSGLRESGPLSAPIISFIPIHLLRCTTIAAPPLSSPLPLPISSAPPSPTTVPVSAAGVEVALPQMPIPPLSFCQNPPPPQTSCCPPGPPPPAPPAAPLPPARRGAKTLLHLHRSPQPRRRQRHSDPSRTLSQWLGTDGPIGQVALADVTKGTVSRNGSAQGRVGDNTVVPCGGISIS